MKKLLSSLILLLLSPSLVLGAPILDTASHGYAVSPTATSFSHTTASGATMAVAACGIRSRTNTVTGVTYGGQALTLIASKVHSAQSDSVFLFYRANPLTGANTVASTVSGGTAPHNCIFATFLTSSTSAPTTSGTGGETTNVDTAVNTDITCPSGDLLISGVTSTSTTAFTSSGTRVLEGNATNGNTITTGMSIKAGAGTTNISEDPNSIESTVIAGICLAAAAAAAPSKPRPVIIVQ